VIKAMLESAALLGVLVTLALLVALALKAQRESEGLRGHQAQMERRAAKVQKEIKEIQEELDQLVQQVLREKGEQPGILAPPGRPAPRERKATREMPEVKAQRATQATSAPLGLRDPEITAFYAPWWRTWLG
jgi:type VI protein secretion system component VasK